ncbi:hypothetical protein M3F72_06520, partial [Corynebacterium sanguinis]|nr:hypothetical protein [Corynebacterium sanguinis]
MNLSLRQSRSPKNLQEATACYFNQLNSRVNRWIIEMKCTVSLNGSKVGPQRGLRPIKDPAISAHRLRRTMAIITASQPDGEIALGISLKHNATRALANSVTSGYGAPSVAW